MNAQNFTFDLKNALIQNVVKPKLFDLEQGDQEIADKKSYLGTPVFSNLEIPAGQYKADDGVIINFEGVRLDTVLFDLGLEKNIVRTAINGRNGTVKQFISLGDYQINVQGLINEERNRVPETQIRQLNAIFRVPQEIEVISEFLDFFDISTVVIQGGGIAQKEGSRDTLFLSVGMLSDTPIELK